MRSSSRSPTTAPGCRRTSASGSSSRPCAGAPGPRCARAPASDSRWPAGSRAPPAAASRRSSAPTARASRSACRGPDARCPRPRAVPWGHRTCHAQAASSSSGLRPGGGFRARADHHDHSLGRSAHELVPHARRGCGTPASHYPRRPPAARRRERRGAGAPQMPPRESEPVVSISPSSPPPEFRSHRRLGEQLDLFHFPAHSLGMACWHAAGLLILRELERYIRELLDRSGYMEVRAPLVCDAALWERSGHLAKFADKMFHLEVDGRAAALRPMNCPGHCDLYAHRPRSYRELPLRIAEQGHVHRAEQSGELNGLLRARSFVIDDAHLFCAPDQVDAELSACLAMAGEVYGRFGLELSAELSLRPEQRLGSDALWDRAEQGLREALDAALFGSFERFVAILIEHSDGRFPLWLAPEAVRVLAVSDAQAAFAGEVAERLRAAGVRAGVDAAGPLGGRIRAAHALRVPVIAVVGAREQYAGQVMVRRGESRRLVDVDAAVRELADE